MANAVAPPPRVKGEQKRLALDKLFPSAANPRIILDDEAQKELDADVAARGVLTPLIVRKADKGKFEILAGFRRYHAAKKAKEKDVPVHIVEADDAEDAYEIMVIENLQRQNIHRLDEAQAFKHILDRNNGDFLALAKRVNKKEPYIRKTLVLNQLWLHFRDWFRKGTLEEDAAFALARLQHGDQERCYKDLEDGDKKTKRVSLADVQNWTEQHVIRDLTRVPWDVKDATLHHKAGACTTCPKRSGIAKDMFADVTAGDSCTDSACFGEKLSRHLAATRLRLGSHGVHYVLVSKHQYETEGDGENRVLGTKDYLDASVEKGQPKACDTLKKGLILKGQGTGTVIPVCLNVKCKVHKLSLGNHGARVTPEEAEKLRDQRKDRAQETEVRDKILTAVLTKTTTALDGEDMSIILNAVFGRLWHEYKKRLLKRWDLLKPPSKVKVEEPPDYDALFAKSIEGITGPGFAKALLEISLIDDVDPGPMDSKAERLYDVAKKLKIDVGQVRKDVAAAAVAVKEKKPKAKAKTKTKK